jgi:acylphosphatase
MSTVARRAVYRGRVQGVGFRDYVQRQATRHGVAGWVRNRSDGTVEAVFSGEANAVDAAIEACRRGPRSGRVDGVDVSEAGAADLGLNAGGGAFEILATL